LRAHLEIDQRDEVGQLAATLNATVSRLGDVVREVQEAAHNVAAGSLELSSSAEEMSQGASEQAGSVEEVSASMEQMVSSIQQNAGNARQTEKIAQKAAEDAREGGKEASTINIHICQSTKPPSSPFRKGERGGLYILRVMNMYMLFVDAA